MELKPDFAFTPLPSIARPLRFSIAGPTDTPLGFLEGLRGTWTGRGFNVIWRPFHGGPPNQDRFLELNLTEETLRFEEIPGPIPNRGLLQADINVWPVVSANDRRCEHQRCRWQARGTSP